MDEWLNRENSSSLQLQTHRTAVDGQDEPSLEFQHKSHGVVTPLLRCHLSAHLVGEYVST